MLPPQWLDAAYMSYAWPEYFRRGPTAADMCKLPLTSCPTLPKGKNPAKSAKVSPSLLSNVTKSAKVSASIIYQSIPQEFRNS